MCKGEEEGDYREGRCSDQLHWPDQEAEALHQSRLSSAAGLDVGDAVLLATGFPASISGVPPSCPSSALY